MTNPLLLCFEPVADSNSEILILGSMPGRESLAAEQYYAHRRNAFWKIMSDLLGFDPDSSYGTRLQELKTARIALWDVLQSCTRVGSLDSSIDAGSITVNDFQSFFRTHDQDPCGILQRSDGRVGVPEVCLAYRQRCSGQLHASPIDQPGACLSFL